VVSTSDKTIVVMRQANNVGGRNIGVCAGLGFDECRRRSTTGGPTATQIKSGGSSALLSLDWRFGGFSCLLHGLYYNFYLFGELSGRTNSRTSVGCVGCIEQNLRPIERALVISKKLGISEIDRWINSELSGYADSGEIPGYRRIRGEVKVRHPYRGWQPLNFSDANLGERLSERKISEKVGELEEIRSSGGAGNRIMIGFGREITNQLMNGMEMPLQPYFHVLHASVVGILDSVRNKLLEWALELEQRGVIGENMTFSKK
jgi:AbiTii